MKIQGMFFLIFLFSGLTTVAQQNPGNTPAEILSNKIADKMKDSLALTMQQRSSIFDININISEWKGYARQQYKDSGNIGYYLQREENKRDSLYRNVLTEEQFLLYKQKKRNLISNN
ncbi:MAG TPA: hypothetical protein VF487_08005 [Chitinophagaceae bacterium]